MKLDAICSKPSYYLAISKKDPQNNNLLLHSKGGDIYLYTYSLCKSWMFSGFPKSTQTREVEYPETLKWQGVYDIKEGNMHRLG